MGHESVFIAMPNFAAWRCDDLVATSAFTSSNVAGGLFGSSPAFANSALS